MSVLYRKDDEHWYVQIKTTTSAGKAIRIWRRSPHNTKRSAQAYENELRRQIATGEYEREQRAQRIPTLEKFAERYLRHCAVDLKPSSYESKEAIVKIHLLAHLGDLPIDEIKTANVDDLAAALKARKLSPKTINNVLSVLRHMLTTAQDWELIETLPRVRRLKVPPQRFRFLDFEVAARLVAAAEPDWRAMIVVALNTGLRLGELLALRWCDVDLQAGRIVVRRSVTVGQITTPKNGREREVPLNETARETLQAHRHLRGDLVFSDERGKIMGKAQCKWPLHRAQRKAGIAELGWHDLRHTFASHLAMRGVALKAVQELLGHSSIHMTMRYAHLSPAVRRDAVLALDVPERNDSAWAANSNQ